MLIFFKPWRRKIGVVTLVMALFFSGVWTRSLVVCDTLVMGKWDVEVVVFSIDSQLVLNSYRISNYQTHFRAGWRQYQPVASLDRLFGSDVAKMREFAGIGFYLQGDFWILAIRDWAIVIPLTLLSACLLLSIPRQQKAIPGKSLESA